MVFETFPELEPDLVINSETNIGTYVYMRLLYLDTIPTYTQHLIYYKAGLHMIKALADDLIILGLSKINIEKLQEGKPIGFNLSELGLPDRQVVIFAGETEQAMAKDLQGFRDVARK